MKKVRLLRNHIFAITIMLLLAFLSLCQVMEPGQLRAVVFTFAPSQAISDKAGTYFVAVNGNDSWSGRLPKPKLTISD